jgi:hypothetical protein
MDKDFSKPVDIKIDSNKLAQDWAIIVLDRWLQALDRYNIGKLDGALWRSFQQQLVKANGDVEAVIFKFLKYGRFVDMGVGRGTTLNERVLIRKFDTYRDSEGKMTGRIARKKKPWYTKTFYREMAKLADLYKSNYANKLVSAVESSLTGNLTMNV